MSATDTAQKILQGAVKVKRACMISIKQQGGGVQVVGTIQNKIGLASSRKW